MLGTMLRTRVHNRWSDLEHLREQWNALVLQSADPSVFLTWEWLDSWWESYGGASEALVLTAADSADNPVVIAPFQRAERSPGAGVNLRFLRFMGDGSYDSDNLDFIIHRQYLGEGTNLVVDWLEQNQREWDVLELNTVPAESPVFAGLKKELSRREWVQRSELGPRVVIHLPETWEGFLDSLSDKLRSDVVRRYRKLEREHGVRIWRCDNPAELPRALEKLFQLNTLSWQHRGQPGSFAMPKRREFYQRMAPRMLERGWLDFWLLDAGDRTVAAEFGFCFAGVKTVLLGGFDPEFGSYSVRNVLKANVIRDLIARGIRFYDFLGGGESHKLRWGGEQRDYVFLSCAAPRTGGAIYLSVLGSAMRGKEWARQKIPASVWDSLRKTYRRLRP